MKSLLRGALSLASPLLYKRFYEKNSSSWKGKKFAVSITFDVEYSRDAEVLKSTVDLLNSYSIKGSFACIGKLVEKFPSQHELIADNGHEVVNHTYSHPNHDVLNPNAFFNRISAAEQEKEIVEFERTSESILGVKPVGFRAPHFGDLNSAEAYSILEKRGYLYSSSTVLTKTKAGGMPFIPSKSDFNSPAKGGGYNLVELPVMTCPSHYYAVFDSYHCYRSNPPAHAEPGQFSHSFSKSLDYAEENGVFANYYFDPYDVVSKKDFADALDLLKQKDCWVATNAEVARFFKDKMVSELK